LDYIQLFWEAKITIDTLNGKVKLKVKPEHKMEPKIKLKGKGFPVYKNEGPIWRFIYNLYHLRFDKSE